jgi:hypothetical protein
MELQTKMKNHKKLVYILLMLVMLLAANVFYGRIAEREIQDALIMERFNQLVNTLDMLTIATNAAYERGDTDCTGIVRDSMEYVDDLYQVYAAAYIVGENNEMELITYRKFETSIFDPFDYPEFNTLVSQQKTGKIAIGYTPEEQDYRELNIYFSWLPTRPDMASKYLVIAGVSKDSVTTMVSYWGSVGKWATSIIILVLNIIFAVMLARRGYLPDRRSKL